MAKRWEDCTPEEKEQRRINFGDCNRDKKAERDAYQNELIRLFKSGKRLPLAARREARRLIKDQSK